MFILSKMLDYIVEIADDASSMVPGPAMSEYELITYLTEMVYIVLYIPSVMEASCLA